MVVLAIIVSGGLTWRRVTVDPVQSPPPAHVPAILTPLGALNAPAAAPAYSLVLGAIACGLLGFAIGNYELPVEQSPPSTVDSWPAPSTSRPSEVGLGSARSVWGALPR